MNNVLAKKQPNEDELAIKARFDRSMVWTSGDSVRYLLVDVIAPTRKTVVANEALPLNLAMVIDRSGSMSGDRLGAAKRAAEGILEALTEKDTISLVSFCHESTVHLQQVRADAAGKRQAGDAIGSIESDGTTNIAEGWMDGARCVGERMDESSEGQHRVVVLSDGYANRGLLDPRELARRAGEFRQRGVYTSTVGIGDDYSTTQLQVLADHGGGRMHDAERPEEIIEVVVAELREIREAAAEDVAVQVVFPPQVKLEIFGTYPFVIDAANATCEVGSLLGGKGRQVVVKVQTPPGSAGNAMSLEIKARWKLPGSRRNLYTNTITAVLTYAASEANSGQERDVAASVEVAHLWHAHVLQQVALMNQERKLRDAYEYMGYQLKFFQRYCHGLPGTEGLVRQLEQVLKVSGRQWNSRAQREIHHRHRVSSRRQADYRSAARPDWEEYLPGGTQDRSASTLKPSGS